MLPRAFGAGFGIGTACAEADIGADSVAAPVTDAAISNTRAQRMPVAVSCRAIRISGFLVNAWSCLAFGPFIVISAKGDIVFP
jgi:hypothetical protein